MKKYESGASKRKKKMLENESTTKIPKITSFLLPSTKIQAVSESEFLNVNDAATPQLLDTTDTTPQTSDTADVTPQPDVPEENISSSPPPPPHDVGLWKTFLPASDVDYWIVNGPAACQHHDDSFMSSERTMGNRTRRFAKEFLYGRKANDEKYYRDWLLYSPSNGNIYCFFCKLLSRSTSQFASCGFNDWSNCGKVIKLHESSAEHRASLSSWLARVSAKGCIDEKLQKQMNEEKIYWQSVLRRVVEVIKFLAQRGLAFRGDTELFGSVQNGNYLGILELLAKFDPFLADHISRFGNKGSGKISYLSSTVCDELIEQMGQDVLAVILNEIHDAKYYSICIDSTPDVSHIDQLTFIVRYVNKFGETTERFLKFFPIESHKADSLYQDVLNILNEMSLSLDNCRGQSYDNAANMAGKYAGLQAKLREINPMADYIPCAAHSLNLVGVASVNCCLDAVNFFGLVQELYAFSVGSTKRWSSLTSGLTPNENGRILTLKTLSSTRWHCHSESVKALHLNYANIYTMLNSIAENEDEKGDARRLAAALAGKMCLLETAFMCVLWHKILQRFQKINTALQSVSIDISVGVSLFTSLETFVAGMRDDFDNLEKEAKELMEDIQQDYTSRFIRNRPKRCQVFEEAGEPNAALQGAQKFRVESVYVILDKLLACLSQRRNAYKQISEDFAFIKSLKENDVGSLREDVIHLQQKYNCDLESGCEEEFVAFSGMAADLNLDREPQNLLKWLKKNPVVDSTFSNVSTALRLFSTLPVTICEGERSFSKLSLIKNRFRSTMTQKRLNSLAVMSIENDVTSALTFDTIIEKFSQTKSRKKTFL